MSPKHRPAIDLLFQTDAKTYGAQVIGVILSGSLNDGTAGLQIIKQQGGLTIVQDPRDARFSAMPKSAIAHVAVDHILPLAEIAVVLATQTQAASRAGMKACMTSSDPVDSNQEIH